LAEHAADGVALWCVQTYLLFCFLISPRLAIRSPVMRCGKTTLLDVIARLVYRPLSAANVTAAAVFRVVEAYRATLLIDEADTFLQGNEELRGVVNSGHRRGGTVVRTVGDDHEPRAFSTYGACAIALIGKLPATLHDRSAPVVDLQRRLRTEKVESFRLDRTQALDDLASKAARWALDNAEKINSTDPKLPDGLFNRDADNWRPLLAIADAAGGQWPDRARKAAALCCQIDTDEVGQTEALLADIREAFNETMMGETKAATEISSADLVRRLVEMEGRPWAEVGKSRKPLTQNQLARLLKKVGIGPIDVGQKTNRLKGYKRERFANAFERYLPPELGSQIAHPRTSEQDQYLASNSKARTTDQVRASETPVSHSNATSPRGCAVAEGGQSDKAHTCVHCAKSDGREQYCAIGDETVWLHPECQHAYVNGSSPNFGSQNKST
jgi:putative DNA primase/helicase